MNTFLLNTYGNVFYTKSDSAYLNYICILNNYFIEEVNVATISNTSSNTINILKVSTLLVVLEQNFDSSSLIMFIRQKINDVIKILNNIISDVIPFKDECL